jgi:hypothetical protein
VYNTSLGTLSRVPPHVRSDFLRVAEWVVGELPRRWRSRLGVPVLWLTLDDAGGTELEIRRTSVYELGAKHGYPDEFRRWVIPAVLSGAREPGVRCAVLVAHPGMSSSVQGPLLRKMLFLKDERVHLYGAHQDDSRPLRDSFDFRRGPLQRIRFTPEVHQRLANARRAAT